MPGHVLESRAQQGRKFRALYRNLGWSRADCAKFLHVSERSLHNWESGRHPVPFAALRLLRLYLGYELPGAAWRDWSISRGKLCTPEGHELNPQDAAWWSLLIRRAHVGALALRELRHLKGRLVGGADAPAGPARRGAPVCGDTGASPAGVAAMPASADPQGLRRAAPLNLSNGHNRNLHTRFGANAGPDAIGSGARSRQDTEESIRSGLGGLGLGSGRDRESLEGVRSRGNPEKAKAQRVSAGPSVHKPTVKESNHGISQV